jgi:hypothetical protein
VTVGTQIGGPVPIGPEQDAIFLVAWDNLTYILTDVWGPPTPPFQHLGLQPSDKLTKFTDRKKWLPRPL